MNVGVCRIELLIPEAHSLKQKRRVIRSLKDRLKNNFNIAVAETADHHIYNKTEVGIACVGTEQNYLNGVLDKAVQFIEGIRNVELLHYEIEFIAF